MGKLGLSTSEVYGICTKKKVEKRFKHANRSPLSMNLKIFGHLPQPFIIYMIIDRNSIIPKKKKLINLLVEMQFKEKKVK